MTLTQKNDRWYIKWTAHVDRSIQAYEWCEQMFGSGWGEYSRGEIGGSGVGSHVFWFHRLSHAQWFMLKWNSI
jgi:hypothetical protein